MGGEASKPLTFSAKLERDVAEIKTGVEVIKTQLNDAKELNHEQRIKELEQWKERHSGYMQGIHWLLDFLIGVIGILIGYFLKL